MKTADIVNFLTFDLTPEQAKFLRDFTWRCVVTLHMAYACGYLAVLGIPLYGFAQVPRVERLEQVVELQTRLGIVREIRAQTALMCASSGRTREQIEETIDRLREDYKLVSNGA